MKKLLIVFLVLIILLGVVAGFGVSIASKYALFDVFLSLTPSTNMLPKSNIMVLGIDNAFGHRSDTIMVLHSDPENKEAQLISVPRDTLAVLPGRGLDKINHAYAYGGIDLTRRSLEKLLGLDIPHYVVVNLSGIMSIIDELGGVSINVEKRMYYVDHAGDLYINLWPGQQKLNGRQAMGYLRYRSDGGDITRISRQQKFLQAIADEMLKRDNLVRTPKMFFRLLSYINTNLNSKQTLGLSLGLRAALERGNFKMTTLPGSDMMVDGIYYLKPNKTKIKEIVDKISKSNKVALSKY